jgi:hypothetical protein
MQPTDNVPSESEDTHTQRAPKGLERTADCQVQDDPTQFVVDWELREAGSNGQRQQRPVDGEKRYDKLARKSPARARWHARRRAERFARRLGFLSAAQQRSAGPAGAEQGATLLVVGGLGDLGRKHLQPALAELPPGVADCLDYADSPPATE